MQDLRISMIQDELVWENPAANRERFSSMIHALDATDLVLLPEMFSTGFTVTPEKVAEEMDGPTVTWMQKLAMEKRIAMAGSIIIHENGQYYNRLIFCHPEGNIDIYDKRHLFRMGGEHERFGMGRKRLIVTFKGWRIMPLVCYDLRFPVWARNTYLDGEFGYDLLIYVANWPRARSHHWKALLTARAIENQCFVAGLNRVGTDGQGVSYSGDSRTVGPGGELLADLEPEVCGVLYAGLEHGLLSEYRQRFKVGMDWDRFSID
ncbi:MAG: amidohydrolase [Bacteroidales bacterium]|nr:amidohydrolase [Bacteroidales bacterium]